jgi:uncharacterized protein
MASDQINKDNAMKTALITGASGGIGCELAILFAMNRHKLVLVARNEQKLNTLSNKISKKHGVPVKIMVRDLSEPSVPLKIYNELRSEKIHIDYLVNNAGFGNYGLFHKTDWEKEAGLINVNIMALTYMSKLFLKDMIHEGYGKIMNVSSTAAFQPGPMMSVYYASKAFVQSFSEALANETAGTGVSITALCPGPTNTGFEKTASLEESKLFKRFKLSSAKEVAEYGYKKMMAGQTVALHGTMNKLMIAASKMLPNKIIVPVIRKFSQKQ